MAEFEGSHGFTSVNAPQAHVQPQAQTQAPPTPTAAAAAASPSTPVPSTAGTKRKRDVMKFYAVRVGKSPGIYHTWAECLDQVRGFPKAMFKSFTSLTDAKQYVEGDSATASGVGGTGKGQKFYAVQRGRVPGVYTSWSEVLDNITGWKGPKHKAFKTRGEAEDYVREGQLDAGMMDSIEDGMDGTPASKKAKTGKKIKDEYDSPAQTYGLENGQYEPGEAPLPEDVEDGFDRDIALDSTTGSLRYKTGEERTRTKYQAVRPAPEAPIRIYTDGSSLSNGQVGAIGGVGVFFGKGDQRNISEGLVGTKQTNQRAELTAIMRALEVAPKDRKIIIFSDSNYAIKCATEWFQKWQQGERWVNAAGKPVENRDLIQKLIATLDERYKMNKHRFPEFEEDDRVEMEDTAAKPGYWEKGPAGVKFVWVKGHAKDEGNNAADSLATAGAREARELVDGGDDEYS